LREEVAYLAYHFHWPLDEILELDHAERQEWVDEVARINPLAARQAGKLISPSPGVVPHVGRRPARRQLKEAAPLSG
jgi:hypothetical protein